MLFCLGENADVVVRGASMLNNGCSAECSRPNRKAANSTRQAESSNQSRGLLPTRFSADCSGSNFVFDVLSGIATWDGHQTLGKESFVVTGSNDS